MPVSLTVRPAPELRLAWPQVARLLIPVALMRLAEKVCPGCEWPIDLMNPEANFRAHCGIGVFERCPSCEPHQSTFERFCYACGTRTGETAIPRAPA